MSTEDPKNQNPSSPTEAREEATHRIDTSISLEPGSEGMTAPMTTPPLASSAASPSPSIVPPTLFVPSVPSSPESSGGGAFAVGHRIADRYRIEGILGVGGMGMVYRAHDEIIGLEVALKVLRSEVAKDKEFLERFRNELVVARQVTHRNVVRIHDIGQDQGYYYMSMDLIEGRSLEGLLRERGRLEVDEAVRITLQMARALDEAHRRGVVHRDLKPANILLDQNGEAYISDFGIARSMAAPAMTQTGIVMGTPHYLSPEQARGEKVDGRSDLYTLGLILVEMLSGKRPVSGSTLVEILSQRMAGRTISLDELGIRVPPALAEVIDHCLAKETEARYQEPSELVADLEGLIEVREGPPRPSASTGRSVASSSTSSHGPSTRLPGQGFAKAARSTPAWLWPTLGWLVVALVAGSWWVWRSGSGDRASTDASAVVDASSAVAAPRHAVAVLPFDQEGGDELAWASTGIAEMLASGLAESEALRVVDSVRVVQRLQDLGFSGRLRDDELRQLAAIFEVDRLVTGRLRVVGGQIRLEARMMEADRPGAPLRDLEARQDGTEKLFDLVGALTSDLRRELEVGETVAVVDADTAGAASPAALRAYGEGVDLLSRGELSGAVGALETAVGEDPSLAAAWLRLSETYDLLGRSGEALDAARQASRAVGETGSRLSYEARAHEAVLRGEPGRAQELLGQLVERYPNDLEALLALASAFGAEGRFSDALEQLRRAAAVDPSEPRVWFELGKYSIQSGDSQRAVDEYLVRALVQQTKLKNPAGQAETHNAFGIGYMQLGLLDQALESYEKAAEIQERIDDREGTAKTLYNLAVVHITRGDFDAASKAIERSLEIYSELDNRGGMALSYNALGGLEEERGRYAEALEAYRRGLQLREEIGDEWLMAESYTNVGFAYHLLGEYDNALLYQEKALALHRSNANPQGEMLALQSIGIGQLTKGQWATASQSFLSSLELSRELGAPNATAVSMGNLGRVAQLQGRYAAAMSSYGEALEILRDLEDVRGQVEITLHTAETLLEIGDVGGTSLRLSAAEELLSGGGNPEQRAHLLGLRGRLALVQGRAAEAAADFAASVESAAASRSPATMATARWGSALHLLSAGKATAARRELRELLAEVKRLGHGELQLRVGESLARAESAAGDAAAAETVLRDSLRQVDRAGSYGRAFYLRSLLADVLEQRGAATAASARRDAVVELERVLENLDPAQREAFEAQPDVAALLAAAG